VAGYEVDSFHNYPDFPGQLPVYSPGFAFLFTGDDQHCIAAAYFGHTTSHYFRGQGNDSHKPLVPQLSGYWSEDSSASGQSVILNNHGGVVVKLDVSAVGTQQRLGLAHYDRFDDLPFSDGGVGDCFPDITDYNIAHFSILALAAAGDVDETDAFGPAVVGHI
jgi:hypothetical protein